jgi:hypothetical protein
MQYTPMPEFSRSYTTHFTDHASVMRALRTGGATLTFHSHDSDQTVAFACATARDGITRVRRIGHGGYPFRSGTYDHKHAWEHPLGTLTIGDRVEFTPGGTSPRQSSKLWARDRAAIAWVLTRLNEGRIPSNVTIGHIGRCHYLGVSKCESSGYLNSVDAMLTGMCGKCRCREGIVLPDVMGEHEAGEPTGYSACMSRSSATNFRVLAHYLDGSERVVESTTSWARAHEAALVRNMRLALDRKRRALSALA